MPTIIARNHPHCRIECPGKGFAIYVGTHGPCLTGCDPATLAGQMYVQMMQFGWDLRFSGEIFDMSHTEIKVFGDFFAEKLGHNLQAKQLIMATGYWRSPNKTNKRKIKFSEETIIGILYQFGS